MYLSLCIITQQQEVPLQHALGLLTIFKILQIDNNSRWNALFTAILIISIPIPDPPPQNPLEGPGPIPGVSSYPLPKSPGL